MNEDVKYIIEIILKANDQISGDLRKLRDEVNGYESEFKGIGNELERVNKGITSLNHRARAAVNSIREFKTANKELGGAIKFVQVAEVAATEATERHTSALSEQSRAKIKSGVDDIKKARAEADGTKTTERATAATRRGTAALKEDREEIQKHLEVLGLGARRQAEVAKSVAAAARERQIASKNVSAAARGERIFIPEDDAAKARRLASKDRRPPPRGERLTEEQAKERREAAIANEKLVKAEAAAFRELVRQINLEYQQYLILQRALGEGGETLKKEIANKKESAKASKENAEAVQDEGAAEEATTTRRRKSTRARKEKTAAIKEETAATKELTQANVTAGKMTPEQARRAADTPDLPGQELRDREDFKKARRGAALRKTPTARMVPVEELAGFEEFDRRPGSLTAGRSRQGYERLKKEIEKHGIKVPIELVVNKVGKAFIGEGNHRLAIAREIGLQEIPVTVVFKDIPARGRAQKLPKPPPEGLENLQHISPEDVGLSARAIEEETQALKRNTAAREENNKSRSKEEVLAERELQRRAAIARVQAQMGVPAQEEGAVKKAQAAKLKRAKEKAKRKAEADALEEAKRLAEEDRKADAAIDVAAIFDAPPIDFDDDDDELSDLDFDEGFPGIGGGAQKSKKAEQELADARDRIRSREVKKLAEIKVAFDKTSASVGSYFYQFIKNKGTEEDWIFRMAEAEKKLRRLARQAAQLTIVGQDQADVIRKNADILKDRLALVADPGTDEALKKDILRNPVSVDVDELRRRLQSEEENDDQAKRLAQVAQRTEDLADATADADKEATRLYNTFVRLRKEFDAGQIDYDEATARFQRIGNELSRLSRTKAFDDDSAVLVAIMAKEAKDAAAEITRLERAQIRNREATTNASKATAVLSQQIDDTLGRYRSLVEEVDTSSGDWREARANVRLLRDELQDLARRGRGTGIDRAQLIRLAVAADHASEKLRALTKNQDDHARKTRGFIARMENLSRTINRQGESVSALDNQLRGLAVLAVMAFAQQLITAMAALGGAFGAVASSAAGAGAAIGGAFVAGMTQALPLIGLVIASLARLKSIMDVVQQSELVDEQKFTRQAADQAGAGKKRADDQKKLADNQRRVADTTDAVTNAQDGLRDANQRLADTHRNLADRQDDLNKARQEARKDLRELIQAERDAELAARGAVLSQAEAQEALRLAVAGGDVEGLARAELGVLEADQGLRVARTAKREATTARRVGTDIEGTEGVVAAKKQIADARREITNAEEAVTKAFRGIERARRGAQAAAMDAADAAEAATTDTFTAASALEYMLAKLSPAERRLYESIQRIRATYRENFRPITDILVNEFALGVDAVNKLLKDPRIIRSARGMALGIAKEIGRFRREFTSPEVIRQFLTINRQARANLEPVGKIFRQLGRIWLNIAEASGPSLTRILNYFVRLLGDVRDLTNDQSRLEKFFNRGTDSLLKFFDAIVATVKVFAALFSIGQETGDNIIEDYTKWAERLVVRIKENRAEVHKFFEDSRTVFYQLIRIVAGVAKAIAAIFNPDNTGAFAIFLTDTLIPALITVIKFVGAITAALFTFLNVPIIKDLAKWGIAFLIFSKIVTSTSNLVGLIAGQMAHFGTVASKMASILNRLTFGRFNVAVGGIQKALGTVFSLLGRLLSRIPLVGNAFTALGAKATVAGQRTAAGGTAAAGGAAAAGGGTSVVPIAPGQQQLFDDKATETDEDRKKRRRRTVVKGVGITALIGAGLAATQRATSTAALDRAPENDALGRSSLALDNLTNAAQSLLSLDIKGFFKSLNRDAGGFADFAKDAGNNLEKFTAERNVAGLKDLADNARKFAESSPQYADDLIALAESAEKNSRSLGEQNKNLRATDELAKKLKRVGITIDVKTRGLTSVQLQEDIQFFMANLRKGLPRNFSDLRKEIEDQLARLNEVWAKNGVRSNDWYKNAASTYEVAIDNLKRLRDEGKISERTYNAQVASMRGQLRLFNADVNDSATFGKEFADKIRDGKGDRQKAIRSVISDLEDMPPAARRQAALMAIGMVRRMEKDRPEMKGAAKRLAGEVGKRWRSMRDVNVTRAQQLVDGTASAIGGLPNAVSRSVKDVGRVLNTALKPLGQPPVKFNIADISKPTIIGKPLATVSPVLTGDDEPQATGGIVGKVGERGRDAIRTVLGRGEMVLNSFHQNYIDPAVQAFYGHPLGKTFNRIRGFHAGGYDSPGFAGGYAGKSPAGLKTVPIPGFPGEFIAQRVLADALALIRRFNLFVTDAFARTGHSGPGHLHFGTAMDVTPRDGNWNNVDRAVAYARSKGLVVLYNGVPNHGRGHHAHIELKRGAIGSGGGAVPDDAGGERHKVVRIRSPRLGGRRSALRDIGQRTISKVVRAANELIRKRTEAANEKAESFDVGKAPPHGRDFGKSSLQIARTIIDVAKKLGASRKVMLAAIETAIVESGIRNLNYGDRDSLGVFQQRPSQGWGTPAQVTNVRYAATQFLRRAIPIAKKYGTAGQLAQAVQRSAFPAKYDQVKAQAISILRKLGISGFAKGGEIPGDEGQPVPILAHAKEWVLNPRQQRKIAQWVGMGRDKLKARLGFSGGPEQFAGGGEVSDFGRPRNRRLDFGIELDRLKNEFVKRARSWTSMFAETAADFGGVTRKVRTVTTTMAQALGISTTRGARASRDRLGPSYRASTRDGVAYPTAKPGKIIGMPGGGTHSRSEGPDNWQSDEAIDIAVPVGTTALAVVDGVIEKVSIKPSGGGRFAGSSVTLRGKNNRFFYAHLSKVTVKQGQRVRQGDVIGRTGSAAGVAHLHFAQQRGNPGRLRGLATGRASRKDRDRDEPISADGGKTDGSVAADEKKLDAQFTTRAERERIRNIRQGIYRLPILPLVEWEDVLREARRAMRALSNIGSSWKKRIISINKKIAEIRGETTDEQDKEIAKLKRGGTTADERKKIQAIRNRVSDDEEKEIKALREERKSLETNKGGARRNLGRENRLKAIEEISKEGGLIDMMTAARARATQVRERAATFGRFTRNTVTGVVRQGAIWPARSRAEIETARVLEDTRTDLAAIREQEKVVTKSRKTVQDRLKILRKGGVSGREAKEVRQLETQLARLNAQYDEIRNAHAAGLEAVFNAQVEQQQAVIDRINTNAGRATSQNEAWKRFYGIVGNNDAIRMINEVQIEVLKTQANQLESRIQHARNIGNEDLARELEDQVRDLRISAFELTQQILRDNMEQINTQATRRLGRLDLFGRMATALGQVGLDGSAVVGGERLSRRGVFAARDTTLQIQRTGLQSLIAPAAAAGNMQLVQDLTDALVELDVTIAENSAALFAARITDVNERTSYALGIRDLSKRIIELNGQITGVVDTAGLIRLTRERMEILADQRTELQKLLFDAQTSGNQAAIKDLTSQLLENEIATLENTISLNELTGVTATAQTFTSSAWTLFREAIFTGMGQVLPQYAIPNSGQMMAGAPSVYSPNSPLNPGAAGGMYEVHEGDTNINLYGYDRPVDLTEIAGAVGFARKTTE